MAPVAKEKWPLSRTFIAEWRDHRGLTQEQLAEKISMSRSALSKIETAGAPYTQRTLEAMARALDCEPYDLLMRSPSDTAGRPYLAAMAMKIPNSQIGYIRGAMEAVLSIKTTPI